ncbi:SAHS2 [Ramazzottius varieornatus]|uniref:Secretory-abundant heat soluble protein 2 n=1 Tax=Ramazzottius varieornatus TaxID=947166 RepID=SAHS2_RAMVA|nr:RecName: Full=Secretory-abundant heat soluble protein 2; Short=SAHS2; AltName: Full=Tardigrade-specific intrinsically disordered protein SAHS2; Short=TDP SAHS2; Flags: Precursor [Ramazzottius varieornatus]BAM37957.1 secretary abundant heat soluble protein 2 [Ramazzottius varieornatus]GAU89940.1 SAHS2 [Ramazzottius varieornatus]
MHRFVLALVVFAGAAIVWAADDAAHEEGVEWTGKPWMGKWESDPSKDENVEEFKKKLQLPMSHSEMNKNSKVWIHHYKKGDEYHHKIIINDAHYKNDIVFKLGQESAGSYNGSSFSVKYEDKDGALVGSVHYTGTKEQSLDKTINNVFKLEGDHLVKTSTIEGVTMKRHYNKRQ